MALLEKESHKRKCKAGDENYCPTVETHPAEVAGFVTVGLVGGPLAENFILGGGLAGIADASLWWLQRQTWKAGWAVADGFKNILVWGLNKIGQDSRGGEVLMSFFDRIGLRNPNSSTMVIGQFPNYVNTAEQNGYSYYQQSPFVHEVLEGAGWAQTNNANVITGAVEAGKTFLVDAPTKIGQGLQFELNLLNILRYPSTWLSGPPP